MGRGEMIRGVPRERLESRLVEFAGKRILVFGDLVADVFTYGEISRISREAPILILSHRKTKIVPGGSANSINNLAALGARPIPVGVLGDDKYGGELLKIFSDKGIDTSGIVSEQGHQTTTKTRISAGKRQVKRQQVVRLDREEIYRYDEARDSGMRDHLARQLELAEAVLISDYGLGVVAPGPARFLIDEAAAREIPVTLDSRWNLTSFQNISAATPNEPEIEELYGIDAGGDAEKIAALGRRLRADLDAEAILVTRGGQGMVLVEADRIRNIPIYGAGEVADVTGAGDTVIATFTCALACGASFHEAALLSNYAGGIVVKKWGTSVVTADEIMEAIRHDATGRTSPE